MTVEEHGGRVGATVRHSIVLKCVLPTLGAFWSGRSGAMQRQPRSQAGEPPEPVRHPPPARRPSIRLRENKREKHSALTCGTESGPGTAQAMGAGAAGLRPQRGESTVLSARRPSRTGRPGWAECTLTSASRWQQRSMPGGLQTCVWKVSRQPRARRSLTSQCSASSFLLFPLLI